MANKKETNMDAIAIFDQYWMTSQAFIKATDSYLQKSTGLSAGKFLVLMVLYFAKGPMASSKLAAGTGTRPHNITVLIRGLKEQGLVATEKGATDNRFVYITLTPEGKALVKKALPAANEFATRVVSSLSEADLAELQRLLGVISNNLKPK